MLKVNAYYTILREGAVEVRCFVWQGNRRMPTGHLPQQGRETALKLSTEARLSSYAGTSCQLCRHVFPAMQARLSSYAGTSFQLCRHVFPAMPSPRKNGPLICI